MKMWNISPNFPVKLECLNISDFVTSAYSIYLCHLKLIQSMHSAQCNLPSYRQSVIICDGGAQDFNSLIVHEDQDGELANELLREKQT